MRLLVAAVGWIAALFLALAAIALTAMGGSVQAGLMLLAALIAFPPVWTLVQSATGFRLSPWLRAVGVVLLIAGVFAVTALNPATSIYKSPEIEAEFHRLYDEKLADWPVPHEDMFIGTDYGRIHVIVSGPEDGLPVLLFNASALAGWSWIHNIAALARNHRVYAIDNIGEVGRNEMKNRDAVPKDGPAIAAYYGSIMDHFGIARADMVGASIGGYIATTMAIQAPDRVRRLVLLCPMGYGPTGRTVAIMVLAQSFPFPAIRDLAFRWALGDDPVTRESFGEWFRLVLAGSIPNPVPPHSFTPGELQAVKAPTLVFFGTGDDIVGDVEAARTLAQNIPDVETVVAESGHMIGAEKALLVNATTVEFLDR
jgi:pimeloyl-ACP methyl ester carboxylesterase